MLILNFNMFFTNYYRALLIKHIALFKSLFTIHVKFNFNIYLFIHIIIYIFIYNKSQNKTKIE